MNEAPQTSLKQMLILLCVSLLIGVLLIEIALRILQIGYNNSPSISHPIRHHVRPPNFSYLLHDPAGEYGGHYVHFDTNGYRAPATGNLGQIAEKQRRVAVLGDSFIEAIQVPYEETAVALMQENASKDVAFVNVGCTSYSPVLHYLHWPTIKELYNPTDVLLVLYANDIRDDEKYASQAVTNAEEKITAVPGPSKSPLIEFARKSYVLRLLRKLQLSLTWRLAQGNHVLDDGLHFIEENPAISKLTEEYLLHLRDRVRDGGATFTITAIPSKERATLGAVHNKHSFHDRLKDWAKQHDIQFIDVESFFPRELHQQGPLFFTKDIHFTSRGHRQFFEAIRQSRPEWFHASTVPETGQS